MREIGGFDPETRHGAQRLAGPPRAMPTRCQSLSVGEETGALDDMLYKVADVYDEEVEVKVESLISLLEPIMVVVLGLIVGFIVIALFLPLSKLLNDLY